jgi:RNA-directed DNA polymerase
MRNILEHSAKDARSFFLKKESYVNFDLPIYFSFQTLIDKIDKKISKKKLSDFRKSSPRDFDDVNYQLLSNKDGKYAWRPFQLIHPAIYVSLVHRITEKENWQIIKERNYNPKKGCYARAMEATGRKIPPFFERRI